MNTFTSTGRQQWILLLVSDLNNNLYNIVPPFQVAVPVIPAAALVAAAALISAAAILPWPLLPALRSYGLHWICLNLTVTPTGPIADPQLTGRKTSKSSYLPDSRYFDIVPCASYM